LHGDTVVLWLNFLLLFGVVLIPLATRLLAAFSDSAVVLDLLAGDLAFNWRPVVSHVVARGPESRNSQCGYRQGGSASRVNALGASVLVFLASMPLAWASASVALWSWLLLVPISWLRFDVGGQTKV
jgi:uncharacterized membrane protein